MPRRVRALHRLSIWRACGGDGTHAAPMATTHTVGIGVGGREVPKIAGQQGASHCTRGACKQKRDGHGASCCVIRHRPMNGRRDSTQQIPWTSDIIGRGEKQKQQVNGGYVNMCVCVRAYGHVAVHTCMWLCMLLFGFSPETRNRACALS